ncbi:MAG: hypothetical protein IJ873_05175 [Lachnospiraceae bacterium]|nr:hypothetical protein [Lachnospiraceae bacterium]
MTSKAFVKSTIYITVGVLLLFIAVVFIFDPFVRYHKPFFGLAAAETEERSAVIGLARNMDYDTALVGSSMSENFVDSWFEDGVFGEHCVKTPLQGAYMNDYLPLLDELMQHKELKNLVFSLDNYLIDKIDDTNSISIPDYFVKQPSITDIYYLLNKSTIFLYLPKYLILNVRDGYTDDNAYVWADRYVYDKYVARADYMATRKLYQEEEKPYDRLFEKTDLLIATLSKYIEQRPDVTFYFYAPPYSILFWDVCVLDGNLTAEICALSRLYEALTAYDNVRLFYFQGDYDLITDLDRYRDYSHYDQAVNYMMYESMRDGRYEITSDTYYDTLLDMYYFALNYDYEQCFH